MNVISLPRVMTGREFATLVGINPATVRKWVRIGKLEPCGTRNYRPAVPGIRGRAPAHLYLTADLLRAQNDRRPWGTTRRLGPRKPHGLGKGEPGRVAAELLRNAAKRQH